MLQPPQQTHEAERVRGGEGGGEGEAVPPRQRPGPGQALHTLDMAAVKSPYILHVDVDTYLNTVNNTLRVEASLLWIINSDNDNLAGDRK